MKNLMVVLLCVSGVLAQDKSAIAKAAAACGPDKVEFEVTKTEAGKPAAAEPGKALVYMVGEALADCEIDCNATIKTGLDGAWVGANEADSYFSLAVVPGEHHVCVKWQSRLGRRKRLVAVANFTAEAGKTYYFRARVYETLYLGTHLDLDAINSDQGQLLVASYPLSVAHVKQ
jgi:hypothetical protein